MVPAHDTVNVELDLRILVHRFTAWPRIPVRGVGSVATALSLRRALAEVRPDVLHAHSLNRYGVAARLSGFHPYVITVWGSDVLIVVNSSRMRRIQGGLALRGADLVTGGSDHLIRAAIAAGARPDRTRFVHFGVDTVRFAPGPYPAFLAAHLGIDGRRVLLSNRTIAPLYRHGVVLEALVRLPPDVVVIMTRHAARPAELAAIQRLARDLGLEDRVRIVDEMSDEEMPDLYRLADVVVSVPASDGGPTTIVEALAVGRPIVATDLPSVREWMGELDAEALVPVDDVEATTEAIRRVLSRDPDAWADHARKGRASVVERADQERSMASMEAFYRELATGRPPG